MTKIKSKRRDFRQLLRIVVLNVEVFFYDAAHLYWYR
jgi:hypothetical protein